MSTALRATGIVAIFTIISKILGAFKLGVLGHELGASSDMDVFVAAFRLPDLIFNFLILGTLSVAFLPVFVQYLNKDRKEAFRVAGSIFNITALVMGLFVLLGILLTPMLVPLITPGFSAEAQNRTVNLTRILLFSPLLFSLSSVVSGILHSHKKFLLAAIAPLFYNISIIFGVLFLYPKFGLEGVGWGVILGAAMHLALQVPSVLRLGLRPFASLDLHHAGVRKIAKLFLPRLLALDLGQISLLLATVIGSSLAVGSVSGFFYAFEIEAVPVGIFAMSFAIAAFPTMSEILESRDIAGFKNFFSNTVVQILFLIIPISLLILILRAQIVRLIPGAGEGTRFTFADTALTAQALGFFALSLFSQSLVPLLSRAFFALQNTVLPLIVSTLAALVNLILALLLSRKLGAPGLALAFSIASLLQMFALAFVLRKRLGDMQDDFVILRVLKISIASISMATAAYLTMYLVAPLVDMQTYLGVFTQTAAALLVALVSYFVTGLAIRLPETRQSLMILKNWFSKLGRPVIAAVVNMLDPW